MESLLLSRHSIPVVPEPMRTFIDGFISPNEVTSGLGTSIVRGTVNTKLGDPPSKRRMRLETVVEALDARRVGWHDAIAREILQHVRKGRVFGRFSGCLTF